MTNSAPSLKPYSRLLLIHEDILVAQLEKRLEIQIPNSSYYGRKIFGSSVPKLEDDFWVFNISLYHCPIYTVDTALGRDRVKGRPGDAFLGVPLEKMYKQGLGSYPALLRTLPKYPGDMLLLRFSFKTTCGPHITWSHSEFSSQQTLPCLLLFQET